MSAPAPALPPDGRQSARALAIARGTGRLLASMGMTALPEVPLRSGRRADLVALGPRAEVWIVEIKSSLEDLRADAKWPFYREHCDRLFFATSADVPQEPFPEDAGLILADAFGAEILRAAPLHPMPGATRKEVLTRCARLAARRLMLLADPAVGGDFA